MASVQAVHNEPGKVQSVKDQASGEPHPSFGPCPNTQVADFNFQNEVERVSFKLNMGDIPLEKEHQDKFIDLLIDYASQVVTVPKKSGEICLWVDFRKLYPSPSGCISFAPHRQGITCGT